MNIRLHFRPNGSNLCPSFLNYWRSRWGWTLKCWENPSTIGFPTKNDHDLGCFGRYHHLRKHPDVSAKQKSSPVFPLHFWDLRLSVTTWFMHEKLKLKRTVSDWKGPKINGSIRISVTSFFPTKNKKEWLEIHSLLKTEQTSHIPSLFLAETRLKTFSNILSPVVDGNQKSLSANSLGWCWNLAPGWDSTRRTSCEGETAKKPNKIQIQNQEVGWLVKIYDILYMDIVIGWLVMIYCHCYILVGLRFVLFDLVVSWGFICRSQWFVIEGRFANSC